MLADAGLDTGGMIAFFEKLVSEQPEGLALPPYLSTHPEAVRRLERLRSLASSPQPVSARLLPGVDWREVRNICSAKKPLVR